MPSTTDMAARFASVISAQHDILAAASDLDGLLRVATNRAKELTRADGAAVSLLDANRLLIRGGCGVAGDRIGVALDDDLHRGVVETQSVMHADEADMDARLDHVFCTAIGCRSMLSAPLISGNDVLGTVDVYSRKRTAFDDFDSYTLHLAGGMISGAVRLASELREHQASEERYRLLFEKNVAGVFRTTVDGRILDCNAAFADYLGYTSREELLSRETWDLYAARSDRESFLATLDREHALTNHRLTLKKKDGTRLDGLVNVSYIPAANGETQLLGTLVDAE